MMIPVLETREAIRKRPDLYIGPLDDPKLAVNLLAEALCVTRSAFRRGETISRLTIKITTEFVKIQDDGPGWDVSIGPGGIRLAEALLTQLFACREAKDPSEAGYCNTGLVTLVALSYAFYFTTHREGRTWRQEFREGQPTGSFDSLWPSLARGTLITFALDKTILPNVEFNAEALQALVAEVRGDGLIVDLHA